jgi:CheY-like chemotaxis protein
MIDLNMIESILLVDDEDLFHLVFEDACSLLDITLSLEAINSADEAEKRFKKWFDTGDISDKPKCVFVDLNIIGSSFDGIELIRRINFMYGNHVVVGIISSSNEAEEQAEEMGRQVVDGYHFLVSIAPETKAAQLPDYQRTINECGIADYRHKGLLLEITFTDGSCYEYFGVNANVYKKLINADKQVRFAKRFIYESFLYRQSKKATTVEA